MSETEKRETLIDKLLQYGVYKIGNKQLFELTDKDLEAELEKICFHQFGK